MQTANTNNAFSRAVYHARAAGFSVHAIKAAAVSIGGPPPGKPHGGHLSNVYVAAVDAVKSSEGLFNRKAGVDAALDVIHAGVAFTPMFSCGVERYVGALQLTAAGFMQAVDEGLEGLGPFCEQCKAAVERENEKAAEALVKAAGRAKNTGGVDKAVERLENTVKDARANGYTELEIYGAVAGATGGLDEVNAAAASLWETAGGREGAGGLDVFKEIDARRCNELEQCGENYNTVEAVNTALEEQAVEAIIKARAAGFSDPECIEAARHRFHTGTAGGQGYAALEVLHALGAVIEQTGVDVEGVITVACETADDV